MDSYIPRIRAGEPCICQNGDPLKYRHYRNTNDAYIGKFCKECRKEWLPQRYITRSSGNDQCEGSSKADIVIGLDLYLRKPNTDFEAYTTARIRAGEPCICMNVDPVQYSQHWNTNGEYVGKICRICRKEWFTKEHLISLSGNDQYDGSCHNMSRADIELASDLYLRKPTELEQNTAFLIQSARTKIDLRHYGDILKPGDHISWHRRTGWWHHAIMREIDAPNNEIAVIQWNDTEHGIQITQESVHVETEEGLFNKMYRIDYPEEVLKDNNTELVLARALSRISDTGYWIPTDNCESFATYCKTGIEQSHQIAWLKGKVKEYLGGTSVTVVKSFVQAGCKYAAIKVAESGALAAAGNIPTAELLEGMVNGCTLVGAGVVVLLESGFVIWDISQAFADRKNGNTSRKVFVEASVRRIIEGVSSAGLTVLGSLAPALVFAAAGSPLGPVGIVVGGIIGGVIGGVLGNVIGTWLGSASGKLIAKCFRDDRGISKIDDLKRADHIVVTGWLLHPRCHAIVVKHDGKDQIKVIRNTYENGVVYEWIQFSQPLYRVEYSEDECCDPDTVFRIATSKMGKQLYSLACYNCKTFARECKTMGGKMVKLRQYNSDILREKNL